MKDIGEKTKVHKPLCDNTLYGLCKSAQGIKMLGNIDLKEESPIPGLLVSGLFRHHKGGQEQ
jgi:hypothetical protein